MAHHHHYHNLNRDFQPPVLCRGFQQVWVVPVLRVLPNSTRPPGRQAGDDFYDGDDDESDGDDDHDDESTWFDDNVKVVREAGKWEPLELENNLLC